MSEWTVGRLGDVVAEVDRRNDDGTVTLVLSVTEGRGIVPQTEVFRKRIATDNTSKYKVVQPCDFAWNPYLLWTGAIGQWLGDAPGVTSPVYPIFRAVDGQDPRFWGLVLTSGLLTPYFDSTATGSIQRRRRTTVPVFEAAPVSIPPLDVQRRIVDVMSAVETSIAALTSEQRLAAACVFRARLALLTSGPEGGWMGSQTDSQSPLEWTKSLPPGWRQATIGEVATVRSGATPRRSEQARYFDGGRIRWVKTGDLNERVVADTDELITEVAVKESSVRLLPRDTVLVAMYGGFGQIGRTARLGEESATNQAISALTELRKDVLPAYLHEALKAGRPKWRLVAASSRKDPNISKKDIEAFDFPLPPVDQQQRIVELLRDMEEVADSLDYEVANLRSLRATLLSSLLNQDMGIPESYDDLLEAFS